MAMSDDPIVAAAVEIYSRAVREGEARGEARARQYIVQKLKSFIADLEGTGDEPKVSFPTRPQDPNSITAAAIALSRGRLPRGGSDQDSVLQTVRNDPGLRGVDIVSKLTGSVHERTVRTSLHRLKRRGLIEPRSGKWWPKDTEQQGEIDLERFEGQSVATD
jgi:hypothetical protein